MRYTYEVLQRASLTAEGKHVQVYGIQVCDTRGVVYFHLDDITCQRTRMEEFRDLLERNCVAPCHVLDIVADSFWVLSCSL